MRHLQRDGVHFSRALGVKSDAAGIAADSVQSALGQTRLATLLFVQQADAIYQHLTLLCPAHQLFQTDVAGVIVSVGDHEQHLLLAMALLFYIVYGPADGFAHGRATARIDASN